MGIATTYKHGTPAWRRGIFPLAMLTVLSCVGFLVQLPAVIELHGMVSESENGRLVRDSQHAMTVAMALGTSALLAATLLWDQIRSRLAVAPNARVPHRR